MNVHLNLTNTDLFNGDALDQLAGDGVDQLIRCFGDGVGQYRWWSTDIQSTVIYARLDLEPVRQSVEKATSAIFEAAGFHQIDDSDSSDSDASPSKT